MSGTISRVSHALATLLAGIALILGSSLAAPSAYAIDAPNTSLSISAAVNDSLLEVRAAAFTDDSRASEFYFAQSGSGRCTITSIAMMVKRAAMLDGKEGWADISEASVTADGWVYGVGVKNEFSTAGYSITYISLQNEPGKLVEMLEEHPEGIAVYDPGVPHAVLLTDYDEETDTFYCADPARQYAGKRIEVSESWNGTCHGKSQQRTLSGFTRAWVIAK